MLPSVAQLTRAAEGVFIVEDVKNIGPNYEPTLLAWEENFRRTWPRFADRYGERFRRMWRFYLLSCAGVFRTRSLQVFSISFRKKLPPLGVVSATRDTPRPHRALHFSSQRSPPAPHLFSRRRPRLALALTIDKEARRTSCFSCWRRR
jgi:hypothetical protein